MLGETEDSPDYMFARASKLVDKPWFKDFHAFNDAFSLKRERIYDINTTPATRSKALGLFPFYKP
jgi:hypothetical protein